MSKFLAIAVLLAAPAAAVEPKKAHNHLAQGHLSTIPMVMMENDCAANSAMNKALAAKRKTALIQNPAARIICYSSVLFTFG